MRPQGSQSNLAATAWPFSLRPAMKELGGCLSIGLRRRFGGGPGQRTHGERRGGCRPGRAGDQGRVDISHHLMLVDHECRPVIPDVGVFHHGHALVVQRQPAAIEPCCGYRMIVAMKGIVHDHDAQVFGCDAGEAQGDEFCDRVVLAIAATPGGAFNWLNDQVAKRYPEFEGGFRIVGFDLDVW